MRVRGVFPRTGSLQFIDGQRVDDAGGPPAVRGPDGGLIMGVDMRRAYAPAPCPPTVIQNSIKSQGCQSARSAPR
jgi:hypothetical protein